jgi:hypothetical protein
MASASPAQSQAAARPTGYITDDQVAELQRLAKVAGVDDEYVCTKAHVSTLHEIKAIRFEAAAGHLKKLAEMNSIGAQEVEHATDS